MNGTPKTLAEAIENGIREKDLPGHIRDFLSQGVGILTLSEDEAVAKAGEYLAKKWGLGKRPQQNFCTICNQESDGNVHFECARNQ